MTTTPTRGSIPGRHNLGTVVSFEFIRTIKKRRYGDRHPGDPRSDGHHLRPGLRQQFLHPHHRRGAEKRLTHLHLHRRVRDHPRDGRLSHGRHESHRPLFLLVFYVSLILLSSQMLNSTLKEKENRVTEMILTTLNPTTLIVGKSSRCSLSGSSRSECSWPRS